MNILSLIRLPAAIVGSLLVHAAMALLLLAAVPASVTLQTTNPISASLVKLPGDSAATNSTEQFASNDHKFTTTSDALSVRKPESTKLVSVEKTITQKPVVEPEVDSNQEEEVTESTEPEQIEPNSVATDEQVELAMSYEVEQAIVKDEKIVASELDFFSPLVEAAGNEKVSEQHVVAMHSVEEGFETIDEVNEEVEPIQIAKPTETENLYAEPLPQPLDELVTNILEPTMTSERIVEPNSPVIELEQFEPAVVQLLNEPTENSEVNEQLELDIDPAEEVIEVVEDTTTVAETEQVIEADKATRIEADDLPQPVMEIARILPDFETELSHQLVSALESEDQQSSQSLLEPVKQPDELTEANITDSESSLQSAQEDQVTDMVDLPDPNVHLEPNSERVVDAELGLEKPKTSKLQLVMLDESIQKKYFDFEKVSLAVEPKSIALPTEPMNETALSTSVEKPVLQPTAVNHENLTAKEYALQVAVVEKQTLIETQTSTPQFQQTKEKSLDPDVTHEETANTLNEQIETEPASKHEQQQIVENSLVKNGAKQQRTELDSKNTTELAALGTAAANIGTNREAIYTGNGLNNKPPRYPYFSRVNEEQGRVVLQARIDRNGKPINITLMSSSGFDRLDRAALKAVKKWKFLPALIAGVPTESVMNLPIRFNLKDS